jgi:hypothetical protein
MARVFSKIKNHALRVALIILCIVLLFAVIVIAFISPITKYMIEKYSEKYVGRKIAMSWLYVNPFSGYVNAHNLIVYEKESPQVFIKAKDVALNISVLKIFGKAYDLSSLNADQLWVNIVQDSTKFNFADLFKNDTLKKKIPYCIRNIKITNSEIHYNELTLPVHYYVKRVNIQCPAIESAVDTMQFNYEFVSGLGSGAMKGSFKTNVKNKDYDLRALVVRLDLTPMEQYVKDFARYGNLTAFLDADVHTTGNLTNNLEMMTTGKFAISDFHFGKSAKEDYISFAKLAMNIDSLVPYEKEYFFSKLVIDSPYIKYEKYDQLDNFSVIFGVKGANIQKARQQHYQVNIIFMIADYLKTLALNLVNSDYHVDQFSITHARLQYNDYSLLEKFSLSANPITITARDISTNSKRMYLTLQSKLNPFGNLNVKIDINPRDLGDFHMDYDVRNLPLPLFNPFMVTSTSHPFHKGTLELYGKWEVINKQINSHNHLLIINPTLADKVKNAGTTKLPMGIILWFVRNVNRTIDVDIPITGDLTKPSYHFGDVILDVLKNIFVKPPTFPYRATVQKEKKKKEDFVMLEWKPRQVKMDEDQTDQLKKISRYMFFHPKSYLTVSPKYFEDLEKEAILFFEAKKKYYTSLHNIKLTAISEEDSLAIEMMSIKDSAFVHYLDRKANPSGIEFTVQGKCRNLIGQDKVNRKYNDIIVARKKEVMNFFTEKKVTDRVTFEHGASIISQTGFSHYIFSYEGDLPKVVQEKK